VLTLFAGLRGLKKKKSEEIVTRLLGWTGTGVFTYIHITWVLINRNTGNLLCFDNKTVLNYSGIKIMCLLSLASVVCNTVIVCCKNQSRSSPVSTLYFSPSNGVVAIKLQKGMDRWLGFRNGLQFGTRFSIRPAHFTISGNNLKRSLCDIVRSFIFYLNELSTILRYLVIT